MPEVSFDGGAVELRHADRGRIEVVFKREGCPTSLLDISPGEARALRLALNWYLKPEAEAVPVTMDMVESAISRAFERAMAAVDEGEPYDEYDDNPF